MNGWSQGEWKVMMIRGKKKEGRMNRKQLGRKKNGCMSCWMWRNKKVEQKGGHCIELAVKLMKLRMRR